MNFFDTISPYWLLISYCFALIGLAYAIMVSWLNEHPVLGSLFRALRWLEVVVGNLLVALYVTLILQKDEVLVVVLVGNGLLGGPQIVASLWRQARRLLAASRPVPQEDTTTGQARPDAQPGGR